MCAPNERGVDFGEEAQDIRRRDSGSLREGSSGTHDCSLEQQRVGYCRVASVLVVEVDGNWPKGDTTINFQSGPCSKLQPITAIDDLKECTACYYLPRRVNMEYIASRMFILGDKDHLCRLHNVVKLVPTIGSCTHNKIVTQAMRQSMHQSS